LRPELALLALLAASAHARTDGPEPPTSAASGSAAAGSYLDRGEIHAAAAKLRADPNLGGEKTLRTLRWKEDQDPKATAAAPRWVTGLIDFLAQSSSLLLWVAGAVCAAIAAVWMIRMLRRRVPAVATIEPRIVSVHGLDIRPESLPDDIGAAALELLDQGREREALSLLYRGALSCAVHRHGVAIGASATEGEALRAVNATLDPGGAAYFSDLVGLWERAVYAGNAVTRERIARLCSSFRPSLQGAPV
jgi:hypothetical protein